MTIQEASVTPMLRPHPRNISKLLCKIFGNGRFNVHHECHPRENYVREKTSRRYREQPCLQTVMEVELHDNLHHTTSPPPKPTAQEMEAKIRECERQGCTKQACIKPIRVVVSEVPAEITLLPGIEIITYHP